MDAPSRKAPPTPSSTDARLTGPKAQTTRKAPAASTAPAVPKRAPARKAQEFHKEEWPFYWIARVNALYTMQMERALRAVDCDISTWRVLAILEEQGVSSISDIALHAVAKLSTITKIVYRMKADGLVDTRTSSADARVTEVLITSQGQHALQRVKDATHGLFERSFTGLTRGKTDKLNESLRQICANLSGR